MSEKLDAAREWPRRALAVFERYSMEREVEQTRRNLAALEDAQSEASDEGA